MSTFDVFRDPPKGIVEIAVDPIYIAYVSEEDYPLVNQYEWRAKEDEHTIYAVASSDGSRYFLHRLIMQPSDDMDVDHIDRDGLNNTRRNLRVCTRQQNLWYRGKPTGKYASDYKGVSRFNGYWVARARKTLLGYFRCEIEAALAYDEYAKVNYGEFANLNFPDK